MATQVEYFGRVIMHIGTSVMYVTEENPDVAKLGVVKEINVLDGCEFYRLENGKLIDMYDVIEVLRTESEMDLIH